VFFVSEVTMSSNKLPILAPNAYDPFEEEARRLELPVCIWPDPKDEYGQHFLLTRPATSILSPSGA
jgi:hypothetical protein